LAALDAVSGSMQLRGNLSCPVVRRLDLGGSNLLRVRKVNDLVILHISEASSSKSVLEGDDDPTTSSGTGTNPFVEPEGVGRRAARRGKFRPSSCGPLGADH
jgi:hypothetical protein